MIRTFTKDTFATILIKSKTHGEHIVQLSTREDYDAVRKYNGVCIQSTNTRRPGKNPTLYPCVHKYENGKTIVKQVHRVLGIEVPEGYVIDHIDGDTFNNCRFNLEVVTRAENTRRSMKRRYQRR